jgi:hypothetical protein
MRKLLFDVWRVFFKNVSTGQGQFKKILAHRFWFRLNVTVKFQHENFNFFFLKELRMFIKEVEHMSF